MIERNVEESLNLVGVQIHRQHAVGAGALEQIGDKTRGDRHARLILAVLSGIAVVGKNGGNALGAAALERVHDDEQFHVRLIRLGATGLNHEHIAAANTLLHLTESLPIGKMLDIDLVEALAEIGGDLLRERQIGRSRENHEIVI